MAVWSFPTIEDDAKECSKTFLRSASENLASLQIQCKENGLLSLESNWSFCTDLLIYLKFLDKVLFLKLHNFILSALATINHDVNLYLKQESSGIVNQDLCKTLKMVMFLTCNFVKKYENISSKSTLDSLTTGKRGRKQVRIDESGLDWVNCKGEILRSMLEISYLPIEKLWDTSMVEEEFIDMISNTCYKLLENPSVSNNKCVKDDIIRLLSCMVKKQNLTLGFSIKLLQLLQLHGHLPPILADVVTSIANDYGMKNIVNEIMREIGQLAETELGMESASSKSVASFLMEMADRSPKLVLSNISIVLCYLEQDPYTLRNGILGMIANILLQMFKAELIETDDKTVRDELLDHLEEHLSDANAWVRSRCLQLWAQLILEKVIPIQRQLNVLKSNLARLQDKSSAVRKSAVHLLIVFLENNPFHGKLSLAELETNYEQEKQKLENMTQTTTAETVTEVCEPEREKLDQEEEELVQNMSQLNLEENEVLVEKDPAIVAQERVVHYLEDAIEFTKAVNSAFPAVCRMLVSAVTSDVIEAINFFVTSMSFGMQEAIQGIRQMLLLIWNSDSTIRDAVVDAYRKIYLEGNGDVNRLQAKVAVKNLILLANGATIGELASLEELISELHKLGHLSTSIIQTLKSTFMKKDNNEHKVALLLLGMAANSDVEIVNGNLDMLVKYGLSNWKDDKDLALVNCVCLVLCKSTHKKSTSNHQSLLKRLSNGHFLFTCLVDALKQTFTCVETKMWMPTMESAITLIYKLADQPQLIVQSLLEYFARQITDIIISEAGNQSCKSFVLARLIAAVGHVTLNELIHLDVDVLNEMKKNPSRQENTKDKSSKDSGAISSPNSKNDTLEDELGMVGAVSDDAESEYIRTVCDALITGDSNLLSILTSMIVDTCSQLNSFRDPQLQAAAVLALTKCMLVSSEFCDEQLQLLFTLLKKLDHPIVRANIVIALSDMAFRFPNLIEPWTNDLYACLHDEDSNVRHNMLFILSNLILNDMIKVRGQISEVAKCIVDEDEIMRKHSRTFFVEMGKKGNAVYNVLPDISSRLSDTEVGVPEEHFRNIMKFLFSFIQKDRQVEGLVEKLCLRFRTTRIERQWRDLAYCLSLLQYSAKSLQKLQENFSCFADKLAEPLVYESLTSILTNSLKFAKPDVKTLIEELQQQINSVHNKGVDDNAVCSKAAALKSSKKIKQVRQKKPSKTPKTKRISNADSDDSFESRTVPRRAMSKRTTAQNPKGRRTTDEGADESFEHRKTQPKSRTIRKPLVFSDSDDSFSE